MEIFLLIQLTTTIMMSQKLHTNIDESTSEWNSICLVLVRNDFQKNL